MTKSLRALSGWNYSNYKAIRYVSAHCITHKWMASPKGSTVAWKSFSGALHLKHQRLGPSGCIGVELWCKVLLELLLLTPLMDVIQLPFCSMDHNLCLYKLWMNKLFSISKDIGLLFSLAILIFLSHIQESYCFLNYLLMGLE